MQGGATSAPPAALESSGTVPVAIHTARFKIFPGILIPTELQSALFIRYTECAADVAASCSILDAQPEPRGP